MDLEIYEDLSRIRQIEAESVSLDELPLESQLSLLEKTKFLKDCEKGKAKGKGFGNASILNPKRDKRVYTVAESKFRQLADSFELDFEHELKQSIKAKSATKNYKLDFYFPKSRIAVEISPSFHFSYKIVFIRDKIRKKALTEHGIRTFTIRSNKFNEIDVKYARKVLRIIKEAGISPECLEYWLNESQTINGTGIAGGIKEPEKCPEFEITPIPLRLANSDVRTWEHFGFGLQDGLYSTKGRWYLPNYSSRGKEGVESLKYRINSSDSQNGAFKWVIESIVHESLHSALFDELGTESASLDNIDKIDDCKYRISSI